MGVRAQCLACTQAKQQQQQQQTTAEKERAELERVRLMAEDRARRCVLWGVLACLSGLQRQRGATAAAGAAVQRQDGTAAAGAGARARRV